MPDDFNGIETAPCCHSALRYIASPLSCNEPWLMATFLFYSICEIKSRCFTHQGKSVLKIDIILPLSVQNYIKLYSFTQLVGNKNVAHKLPGFK
jgi:hypothetical protein